MGNATLRPSYSTQRMWDSYLHNCWTIINCQDQPYFLSQKRLGSDSKTREANIPSIVVDVNAMIIQQITSLDEI